MSMHSYADTLSHALSHVQSDGIVRLGYQSHEVENDTNTEFALGVKLHFETAPYYGVQAGSVTWLYGDQIERVFRLSWLV